DRATQRRVPNIGRITRSEQNSLPLKPRLGSTISRLRNQTISQHPGTCVLLGLQQPGDHQWVPVGDRASFGLGGGNRSRRPRHPPVPVLPPAGIVDRPCHLQYVVTQFSYHPIHAEQLSHFFQRRLTASSFHS